MKLVYKTILIVILPVVIASGIIIHFFHDAFFNEAENYFEQRLERTTKDYATLVDLRLKSFADHVHYIARNINTENISQQEAYSQLDKLINYDTIFYGASVYITESTLNNKSSVFYYVHRNKNTLEKLTMHEGDKEFNDYFSKERDWLSQPVKLGKGIWTSPYYDEGAGNISMFTYSFPLMHNGNPIGVITLDIKLNDMKTLIQKSEKPIEGGFNSQVYIINTRDSLIVYAEREDMIGTIVHNYTYNNNVEGIMVIDSVISGKTGSGEFKNFSGAFNLYAFYAPIISTSWIVVDVIPKDTISNHVEDSINNLIIILILSMFVIVVIVYINSNLITKPITKLSNVTVDIAKGNYNYKIDLNKSDEIGTLATNINKMALDIKNREEQLKESNISLDKANKELLGLDKAKNDFLMLLSHEIRTPLNGIIGSTSFLEEMINDPELKDFVDMLKESVKRLDSFSKTALEITQLKTMGEKVQKQNTNATDLIQRAFDQNKEFADSKKITITINCPDNLHLWVNPDSAIKALSNILNNAVKFAFENTETVINVTSDKRTTSIEFINYGVTIDPDRLEKLTGLFELGQAHYDKNTGLGLAYVKAFLDAHNATLKVDSKKEITNFTVCFTKEEE